VLANLLPDLSTRLAKMPTKSVTRLVAGAGEVALRLVRLRGILPTADVSGMVGARLSLLLDDDLGEVEAAVARLRELLPGIDVDRWAGLARWPGAWRLVCGAAGLAALAWRPGGWCAAAAGGGSGPRASLRAHAA
jgi:hypothetical protein